jgi:WD40 repeat protein
MTCSQCGHELRPDTRFCTRCGTPRAALPDQFVQVEAKFKELRARFDSGGLTEDQLDAAVSDLTFEYEGRPWILGANTGTWFVHDGSQWNETPPPSVQAKARPRSTPGTALVWRAEYDQSIDGVAFSADGRHIFVSNGTVNLPQSASPSIASASSAKTIDWYRLDRNVRGGYLCDRNWILGVGVSSEFAVSPDGRQVCSRAGYQFLLWDVTQLTTERSYSLEPIREVAGPESVIEVMTFTRDGRAILFAEGLPEKGRLRLWDLDSGRERMQFVGHDESVNALAVSVDGRYAASGAYLDFSARVWDLANGREFRRWDLGKPRGVVTDVAFSPDGGRLAVASPRHVQVFDIQSGGEVMKLDAAIGATVSVVYSPDGRRVVGGGHDGIAVWDAQTGREIAILTPAKGDKLAISPDGRTLVSGGTDKSLRVWTMPI